MRELQPDEQTIVAFVSGDVCNDELDPQGRIVVPQLLRDSASIVGDVRVFGKIDYLEVWNDERFAQKLARDQWTDEDGLKLSEHGI